MDQLCSYLYLIMDRLCSYLYLLMDWPCSCLYLIMDRLCSYLYLLMDWPCSCLYLIMDRLCSYLYLLMDWPCSCLYLLMHLLCCCNMWIWFLPAVLKNTCFEKYVSFCTNAQKGLPNPFCQHADVALMVMESSRISKQVYSPETVFWGCLSCLVLLFISIIMSNHVISLV